MNLLPQVEELARLLSEMIEYGCEIRFQIDHNSVVVKSAGSDYLFTYFQKIATWRLDYMNLKGLPEVRNSQQLNAVISVFATVEWLKAVAKYDRRLKRLPN